MTDIAVFESSIKATRATLKEGVESIDIWNVDTGLSLADWQGNDVAVALFTQLISEMNDSLQYSLGNGFDTSDYLYLELTDAKSVVVINHGDGILEGWLINANKTQPGVFLGIGVPAAIAIMKS